MLHQEIEFKESWVLFLNLCSRKWLRPVNGLVKSLIMAAKKKLFKVSVIDCKYTF